ncbi:MAG: hypothetical protein ABI042_18600 [Verrucomicrobiota bacterium]
MTTRASKFHITSPMANHRRGLLMKHGKKCMDEDLAPLTRTNETHDG